MIRLENHGSVALLRIEHGKVNAMDEELLTESLVRLEEIEKSTASAVVLTGRGNVFSAGVDLFRVLNGGNSYLQRFLPLLVRAFEKIFLFPKPLICAINGHAIAGGCILACASDYRIAQKGDATIGVSELLVGVPFPPLALEIVRFAAANHYLQEIVYTGKYYSMDAARERGLIDEIVSAEGLVDRAKEIAGQLGSIPSTAFRVTKRQLREPYVEFARKFGVSDQQILSEWSDPVTHEVIRSYLQKTIGKR